MYQDIFDPRGVNFIKHYNTPRMTYPTLEQNKSISTLRHIWKFGDRYYKLAHEHYGDSRLWWIVAWYNQKPTEAHIKLGDVIHVPFPLEVALSYMRVF